MSNHDNPEEVGYRKPPQKSQFVKGQSGNPNGRPKGSKNLDTIVNKIGRQRVRVRENSGSRSISKLEATVIQLTNQAASGDLRAIRELLHLHRLCEESARATIPPPILQERDKTMMESIIKRIRQAEDSTANAATDAAEIKTSGNEE